MELILISDIDLVVPPTVIVMLLSALKNSVNKLLALILSTLSKPTSSFVIVKFIFFSTGSTLVPLLILTVSTLPPLLST